MEKKMPPSRKLAVGAEVQADGGAHFRVWAPRRRRVEVALEAAAGLAASARDLQPEGDGYFSGHLRDVIPGTLYRFRLDGGPAAFPDPASRFQPQGPHGPSQIVDPGRFRWTDQAWRGC